MVSSLTKNEQAEKDKLDKKSKKEKGTELGFNPVQFLLILFVFGFIWYLLELVCFDSSTNISYGYAIADYDLLTIVF